MDYCTNCGAALRPTARFCSSCGKSASRPDGETPPVPDVDGLEKSDRRNSPTDERIIGKSKGKLILCFLGSLVFIAISLAMFMDESGDPRTAIAPLGLLFSGGCLAASLSMLFSGRPGLLLNSEGFEFSGSAVKCGFVRWHDVSGFREHNVAGTRFLVVIVKDPDRFVQNAGIALAAAMKANTAMYGGPIGIASTALAIDFDELVSLFSRYYSTYQS